ncbi:aminopeptidase N-like [Haemaphysalis longicornis]
MYESSAERVIGSRPKSRAAARPSTLQNIRQLVGQRKWQFVIAACLTIAIAAVVAAASMGRSVKTTSHRSAPRQRNAVAQSEHAKGGPHGVHNAPAAEKKHVARKAAHHVPKAPKVTTHKKHKRVTPVARKPPRVAEEKQREDSEDELVGPTEANVQNAPALPERHAPVDSAAMSGSLHLDVTMQNETEAAVVATRKTAVHKVAADKEPPESRDFFEGNPTPSNESIYRFGTAPVPNDASEHNVEDIRLPRTVRPLTYQVTFEPIFNDQSMSFRGHVHITLEALQPTKTIQLHAANLAIDRSNVTLNFVSGAPGPDILSIRSNDYSQFLYINLAEDLLAGDKYYLDIPYTTAALYDNGFNVRRYEREQGDPVWVYGANFLPTEARRAFPCFDEPGMKAAYIIQVTRPKNIHSLSNMPRATTYKRRNERETDVFITSFPMSTFCAGFFISDFVSYGNGSMKLWARPNAAKDVDFLLEMGPKILSFYETYFNAPYQIPKTDVIAMEHYISDIQNMGLLYLPESVAFYDAEDSSIAKRQSVMLSLCHAFSHEWFGNLVSPEWWDDVWLMDGFATYFQYRCLEYFDQSPKSYDLMVVNEIVSVMKHDIMKYAPAVVPTVDTQYKIYQAFNVFSTQKAVALLRMLDLAVGEGAFKRGVHNILINRMFGNVTSKFVWEAFTQAMPKHQPLHVDKIMEPWVIQPGFPVLTVNRVYDENAATLVQSRFALEAEERESSATWPIPITFVTSEDRRFNATRPTIWLFEKEGQLENLPSPHHWILINNKFASYYKVNYDVHNWDLIIRQLLWNHTYVDPLNRAQIQNDLFDLAKAGLVNYSIALEATKYLLREQDYIPWKAAFEKMKDVGVRLQSTESYSKWKGYMSSLLSANFANISWDSNETSPLPAELESELASLTCYYGYQPCIDKAMEMFKEIQESTQVGEDMPNHLRYAVFCQAVKTGGEKNWKFLWDRLQETEDPSERADIIKALSCSRSAQRVSTFLKSAVAPGDVIRNEDVPGMLTSFSRNDEVRPVALRFISNEWGAIHKRFQRMPEVLFQIEESLIESASKDSEVDILTSFYKRNKQSTTMPEWRYRQAQEERKLDDAWKAKFYPVIKHWLDEKVPTE